MTKQSKENSNISSMDTNETEYKQKYQTTKLKQGIFSGDLLDHVPPSYIPEPSCEQRCETTSSKCAGDDRCIGPYLSLKWKRPMSDHCYDEPSTTHSECRSDQSKIVYTNESCWDIPEEPSKEGFCSYLYTPDSSKRSKIYL